MRLRGNGCSMKNCGNSIRRGVWLLVWIRITIRRLILFLGFLFFSISRRGRGRLIICLIISLQGLFFEGSLIVVNFFFFYRFGMPTYGDPAEGHAVPHYSSNVYMNGLYPPGNNIISLTNASPTYQNATGSFF